MTTTSLADLGWSAHFDRQTGGTDDTPFRLAEVHRNAVSAISPDGPARLNTPDTTGGIAVGDWVLARDGAVTRVLDRQSEIARRAA